MQAKRAEAGETAQATVPPIVNEVLRSSGQPLDTSTRKFMESRFGHDFSQVRVHNDSKASESAAAVNALAYTVGSDIVFRSERYRPETSAGKKLLAHELTHTIQQSGGIQTRLEINEPGDAFEQEAEAVASAISNDVPLPVSGRTHGGVMRQLMRQPDDDPPKFLAKHPAAYGPFLLPEVVVTATQTSPLAVGTYNVTPVYDVKFVKVEAANEVLQRAKELNRQADEFLKKERQGMGEIRPGPEEVKRQANEKAQATLKEQYGDFWGTFFWWTRGGGQTGEGSPLWNILPGLRSKQVYQSQSIPAFPTQKPVYPDSRGTAFPTESGR